MSPGTPEKKNQIDDMEKAMHDVGLDDVCDY